MNIVALATSTSKAAIGIVRLSGPQAYILSKTFFIGELNPRHLTLKTLRDPLNAQVIDKGLVVWFPCPTSYTGEEMVEFQVHGGLAVQKKLINALLSQGQCRLALPGEFTKRAVLNHKIDLLQAEAVMDLITAETEQQRLQAIRQLEGKASDQLRAWHDSMVGSLAKIEACIEFSEEDESIERVIQDVLLKEMNNIREEVQRHLERADRTIRLREGVFICLVGEPNSGKSSLLNCLAQSEVAIVTNIAGTTRDSIEVNCEIDGIRVTLIDTAGIREATDAIEREGIRRSYKAMESADLVLHLIPPNAQRITGDVEHAYNVEVYTKADLYSDHNNRGCASSGIKLSVKTGENIDQLISMISDHIRAQVETSQNAIVTRERHRRALRELEQALANVVDFMNNGYEELASEELKKGIVSLSWVMGDVSSERVLDHVFSEFCIGK